MAKRPAATRRFVLTSGALSALPAVLTSARAADAADPRLENRLSGNPGAKIIVMEVFSYTSAACARFAQEVFPRIETDLIATGKLRYMWQEIPRDKLDLAASMLARALPRERFEGFTLDLLRSQKTWAFDRSRDSFEELAKLAALAGMGHELFDHTLRDTGFSDAVIARAVAVQKTYGITSTPSFATQGKIAAGALSYADFVKFAGL